jgi:intracellular proteinase inhibitor BsuPI
MKRAFAPLLLLAAALAACRPQAPAPAPGAAPAAAEAGPLVTTLQVEAGRDSVRFTLSLTNASAAPLALQFTSAQRYDFAVEDGGRTLWRWSEERGFAQVLGTETLAPGETRTFSASWMPPPGLAGRDLTAVGTLTAANLPREQRSAFRIP